MQAAGWPAHRKDPLLCALLLVRALTERQDRAELLQQLPPLPRLLLTQTPPLLQVPLAQIRHHRWRLHLERCCERPPRLMAAQAGPSPKRDRDLAAAQ